MIALELMCHVAFPYGWKEFLFHLGCSYDVTSILKSGLIAGGRESKEGRKTDYQLSTHSGTIQTKKNLAMVPRSREKYTITASGNLVRTPYTGSIKPEQKTKDYSSGQPDPMPQLYKALCRQIASLK